MKRKRTHVVKVTLNDDEINKLDSKRNRTPRATYLRKSALSDIVHADNETQKNLILQLARIGNNLNQITKQIHMSAMNAPSFERGSSIIARTQFLKELHEINQSLENLWRYAEQPKSKKRE